MKPLVSIVIPCYRGEQYLAQAIESCLAQSYDELEVIVVDDRSPDNCAAIAEAFARCFPNVRLLRRPQNGGVSQAFNSGFATANGSYFTRLAQDDVFRPDAIEKMVALLESCPDMGLTYCDCILTDQELRPLRRWTTGAPENALTLDNDLGLCVMWRREVWETCGGFDSDFDTAEDYEYWLRVQKHFRLAKCGEEAPFYLRLHDEMGSVNSSIRQRFAVTRARCRHLLPASQHAAAWAEACLEASWICRERKEYDQARQYARRALTLAPLVPRYWKVLAGATLRLMSPSLRRSVEHPRERMPEWLAAGGKYFA